MLGLPRLAVAITLIAGITPGAATASDQGPAYEVASIKPRKSEFGPTVIRPTVRERLIAESAPLASLIQWAWSVEPWRLAGASGWI